MHQTRDIKNIKVKMIELKEKIKKSIVLVGDFNIFLSLVMEKLTKSQV